MDLEFTAEQEALRAGARELLEGECPSSAVRDLVDNGRVPEKLWPAQVEGGWSALALPEAVGGLGLGAVEVAVVAEEAGRAIAPGPWLATVTQYAAVVAATATGGQLTDLLTPIVEGTGTGALALAEDLTGNPPMPPQTTATDGRLSGTKHAVVDGATADRIVVVAGNGLFIVDRADVRVEPVATVDRTRPWARIHLDNTPAEAIDTGPEQIEQGLQLAVVALAAETVGACVAIVDRTIEYAKQREQFGVPIGSFQAIKHKLADDYLAVERARASVYFAALTIAEDDERRRLATAMAKVAAGDCERRVVGDAVQTHGGIGYTWEHDLQMWVKRAMANGALLGTAGWHRARLADLLGLPR
ncbi:MAG: acyl-CoA dehydrogenase family protein [Actinomycetes bacterium]